LNQLELLKTVAEHPSPGRIGDPSIFLYELYQLVT